MNDSISRRPLIAFGIALAAVAVWLLVAALPSTTPAFATVGGPTCSVPGDYATIQAAVSVAGCTTVNVAAGTYTENVTISHSLILNGAQAEADARSPRGAESIINGGASANITIRSTVQVVQQLRPL
jgi:hypothetical protein